MKHIHLDLHVNMHVIGTVIVSSLTVASLAAIEYVHLNSALAYEKETIYAQFQKNDDKNNNALKIEAQISELFEDDSEVGVYSDEVALNSADELSAETLKEKKKMKKAFVKMLKNNDSTVITKAETLTAEQKTIVLERIEEKIAEIESTNDNDKRLGHLLAAKDLFMGQ